MALDSMLVEPAILAEQHEKLQGELELKMLQRLQDIICDSTESVAYQLEFVKNAQGFVTILGNIDVSLQVNCQRCLQPFTIHLGNNISIGVVANKEEGEQLPDMYEPVMQIDGQISLLTLIEDEILLALPMAPIHEIADCPAGKMLEENFNHKDNPFRVLKDFKTNSPKVG